MSTKYIIAILILVLLGLQSCFKIETYPDTPHIELIDFTFVDTIDNPELGNRVLKGTLHFYFVDGNGDIGFDTTSPRQNTIFLEKYRISGNQAILIDLLEPLNFYVPEFTKSGSNSTLKGEMFVLDLNEYFPLTADTLMYKFYIVDRDGNKSNVDSTGYLILE
jgi:hypothetical protein